VLESDINNQRAAQRKRNHRCNLAWDRNNVWNIESSEEHIGCSTTYHIRKQHALAPNNLSLAAVHKKMSGTLSPASCMTQASVQAKVGGRGLLEEDLFEQQEQSFFPPCDALSALVNAKLHSSALYGV
jgi:hypothetical protein